MVKTATKFQSSDTADTAECANQFLYNKLFIVVNDLDQGGPTTGRIRHTR